MTIRKRLFLSNILMIFVPVIATAPGLAAIVVGTIIMIIPSIG